MKVVPGALPGVVLIEPRLFPDQRGYFLETYQARRYAEHGLAMPFVQDNLSFSRRGVVRGLHYQLRQPQGKLVMAVRGAIWDVAVDIRRGSPTFGRWVGASLSADNRRMMWVPPGFAHGFYTVSAWAELLYKVTDFYAPEWDRTLIWNDPAVGIDWPLVGGQPPILSAKDQLGKRLIDAETFD